jgi:hypothetical protein
MSTLLDMVGSFVIGGMLLMMILNVNANYSEQTTENQLQLIVQENLAELVSEIEFDFRKIGYHVNNPALAITQADTSSITFWGDVDNNGTVDQVRYWLGPLGEVYGTVNPRDRMFHRSVNGQTISSSLGVVNFRLRFYDVGGASTNNLTLVKRIDYYLLVENAFPVDTVYARAAWNGTIRPKNL